AVTCGSRARRPVRQTVPNISRFVVQHSKIRFRLAARGQNRRSSSGTKRQIFSLWCEAVPPSPPPSLDRRPHPPSSSDEDGQRMEWWRHAYHGLVLIKGRVKYRRYARQIAEASDQLVISWIG